MHERQPIFNAPAVVVALLGAFATVHLARVLLSTFVSEAADDQLVQLLAFDPTRLSRGDVAGGPAAVATQFVTHVFVHGDFTHLIINSAWFLVFATPVERRIGTARFLAFFLLCGVGGALLYLPFNAAPMVGASGAISGLMGAAIRFLFVPLSQRDLEALADAQRVPLLSLAASLRDWRILIAIAVWTLLNIAIGTAPLLLDWILPRVDWDIPSIAWQAHLGGFFTGFLTFGWLDPKPPVQHNSPLAE